MEDGHRAVWEAFTKESGSDESESKVNRTCDQEKRGKATEWLNDTSLYQFPNAALTKEHKFNGLKQYKCGILPLSCKAKTWFSAAQSYIWRLSERMHSLPSPASRGCPHSLACDPLPSSKLVMTLLWPMLLLLYLFSDSPVSLFPLYEPLWLYWAYLKNPG